MCAGSSALVIKKFLTEYQKTCTRTRDCSFESFVVAATKTAVEKKKNERNVSSRMSQGQTHTEGITSSCSPSACKLTMIIIYNNKYCVPTRVTLIRTSTATIDNILNNRLNRLITK